MNNSVEFSFKINDEEMEKLKKILTSGGLRHYLIKITNGEELDVVEYKEYQKLEKENQKYKETIDKANKWVRNYMDEWDMNDEVRQDLNDLLILLKEVE